MEPLSTGVVTAIFGGMAAIVLIVIVIAVKVQRGYRRKEARRAESFAAAARSRGWSYRADDPSLIERYRGGPIGTGIRRAVQNVCAGEHRGRAFSAFEYRWDTSGSDGVDSRHTCSVVAAELGAADPSPAALDAILARCLGAHPELEWRRQDNSLLTFRHGQHDLAEIDARLELLSSVIPPAG